jgi:hypothetical protein
LVAWATLRVDELSAHGQVEAGPHDHVDLVHGLGGEAGAVPAAGRGELVVQAVEVVGRSRRSGTWPMDGLM